MEVSERGSFPRLAGKVCLFAALLCLLAIVSGCTGRGGSVPYEPAGFGAPDVETFEVTRANQVIAPLDKLDIKVFQSEALSGEFQVDASGSFTLPLIGQVQVQGRTAPQLAEHIAQRLAVKYMQSPDVRISVKESVDQTLTVDGSVRQPGVFPVKGRTSLLKAVALARGITEDANPSRVVIFRTINGEQMAGAYDLAAIRKAEAPDPQVYGNDIVIVDGSRARQIFRDLMGSIPLLGVLRPF